MVKPLKIFFRADGWISMKPGYLVCSEAVLTSTHNLCFEAKIRKLGIPWDTPVLLYKSVVQGGIRFTDMFS